MTLTERSVKDLLAAFQSSDPTPGGGSASALAGAIGASLIAMVAGLPKDRAVTDEDRAQLREAGARARTVATELTALVDRDSEAYELVMNAYRLPKGTPEEKAARSAAIQQALRQAISAPLDIMRACASAADAAALVAQFGNPSASSDVQVGLELLGAGMRGAKLNVEINLNSVKDTKYVESVRREIESLIYLPTTSNCHGRR